MLKCQLFFSCHPLNPNIFHVKNQMSFCVVLMIMDPIWTECEGQVDFPSGSKVPSRFLEQTELFPYPIQKALECKYGKEWQN